MAENCPPCSSLKKKKNFRNVGLQNELSQERTDCVSSVHILHFGKMEIHFRNCIEEENGGA